MKNKKRNFNKNTRKRNKRKSNNYLFASIFLFSFLLIYLFNYFFGFSFFYEFFDEPVKFELDDECSMIVGRLIHQIRDSADCELQCKNLCDVKQMDFDSFNFNESINSCHTCICACD